MVRFAHTSDIHLGFQREPALQDVELQVFCSMMDSFIAKKVDFVLMPGDIFHTNIPRMKIQKYAFEAFRRVHDAGIPIYVVYGSHDFSPVSDSVIDLLAATGYVTKVMLLHDDGENIHLGFVEDEKTGIQIAGLFGLKQGKDELWYDRLDLQSLEAEKGQKIFLFHGAVSEMNEDEEGDKIPLNKFPKGFLYYAGGHMHKYQHYTKKDYPHVVYPGTPFAGFHMDLEDTANGVERGYCLVGWDKNNDDDDETGCKNFNLEFVELPSPPHQPVDMRCDDLDPETITGKILDWIESSADIIDGSIILIKLYGQMKTGRVSSIDVASIRKAASNAVACIISMGGLKSMEYDIVEAVGDSREDIINNVLAENISQFKGEKFLEDDAGMQTATTLLHILEKPKPEGQTKSDYDGMIMREARAVLDLP